MTGITLPTDTQQSRLAPRATAAHEDVLDTLREYERLARVTSPGYTIASRFTADGETWVSIWLSTEPPAGVKTAVVRDGVATEEARSWHEALPAEGEQRAEWIANPATRLRAFVERAALRRAFADVIVGRDQGATTAVVKQLGTGSTLTHPWDEAPVTRNEGEDVWAPAASPDADWTPAKDAWEPAEQVDVGAGSLGSGHSPSVETAAQREGSGGSVEDPSTHLIHEPAPARPAPQDHLPGNRAQRRAKKRGRR